MQTQDVDRHSSGGPRNEALASHERGFANGAYSFSLNSAMLTAGCTRVTLTSPFGRSGSFDPVTPGRADKRDRRNTCRTASRAFSQLASWPLSQLAHSPHRKNLSLSSPSRFRPNRSSPVNTSNLSKVEMGQATSPVPLLSHRDEAKEYIDLRQLKASQTSDTDSAHSYYRADRSNQKGEGLCFSKQKQHSVSPRFAGSLPAVSRNHRHRSVFSPVSQNLARLFARRVWFFPVISAFRLKPRQPLHRVSRAGTALLARLMNREQGQGRVLDQGQGRVLDLDPTQGRVRTQVLDRTRDLGRTRERVLAAPKTATKRYQSSIPQAAVGWAIVPFAACGAVL